MPIVFNLPLYVCLPVPTYSSFVLKYKKKVKISNI